MRRNSKYNAALKLRKSGFSYSYIANELTVAKSTLSDWLSHEPYTPNAYTVATLGKARTASILKSQSKKSSSLARAQSEADHEIGDITSRDLLMFGLGLYFGEGSKTADIVRIVNADPAFIEIAMLWFESLGVRREQFSPRIHLYPDNNIATCTKFWSQVTGLPIRQFQRPSIDVRMDKKRKKYRKLPYGTLHLSIRSGGNQRYGVFFFRKIAAWNEAVLRSAKKRVWSTGMTRPFQG